MKSISLTIALAVGALLIGTCAVAPALSIAPTDVTYVFTADPDTGITAFNGSTITIKNNSLMNWMLMGNLSGGPLDPSNSSVNLSATAISSYDPTTWTGYFEVDANSSLLVFNGTNNTGAGTTFDPGTLDDHYSAGTGAGDPAGRWTPVPAPDSGTTMQLLGLALVGLGACRQLLRRVR